MSKAAPSTLPPSSSDGNTQRQVLVVMLRVYRLGGYCEHEEGEEAVRGGGGRSRVREGVEERGGGGEGATVVVREGQGGRKVGTEEGQVTCVQRQAGEGWAIDALRPGGETGGSVGVVAGRGGVSPANAARGGGGGEGREVKGGKKEGRGGGGGKEGRRGKGQEREGREGLVEIQGGEEEGGQEEREGVKGTRGGRGRKGGEGGGVGSA